MLIHKKHWISLACIFEHKSRKRAHIGGYTKLNHCAVPKKYPYSPHRRDWNLLEVGGSVTPKNLKKCMKLNWNFQRGGGFLEKIPSLGEVWIFSRIAHYVWELCNFTAFTGVNIEWPFQIPIWSRKTNVIFTHFKYIFCTRKWYRALINLVS